MKPSELYAMTPEKTDNDIFVLSGTQFNHVPEIDWSRMKTGFDSIPRKQTRITIKYYKDFEFDVRRIWRLASVWLDDKPVMIIQNAGREGDDWRRRIITDASLYCETMLHLMSLQSVDVIAKDFVNPEVDITDLTEFYGSSLTDRFEKHFW